MKTIIQIDDNYKNWLEELSDRFRSSQIKAAIRVNNEMLRFYWSLGRDILRWSFRQNTARVSTIN